jgi:hypothetical protein
LELYEDDVNAKTFETVNWFPEKEQSKLPVWTKSIALQVDCPVGKEVY